MYLSFMKNIFYQLTASLFFMFIATYITHAGDWPQYRANSKRTAETLDSLPTNLKLLWTRQLALPQPAWPDNQKKLLFDKSYALVVFGDTLFIGSMVDDTLTAYSTLTGAEKWRFYAKAPVRFAPVAWEGKVAFGSDDGSLYCLNSKTGKLVWERKGAPDNRQIIGNKRLISMWPVRGGPVLFDNNIYFSAGIWPFMGIFIYAIDKETGNIVWENSNAGSIWMKQPHMAPAFAGVAPQGCFVASDTRLIVPNGRSVPAGLDIKTGKVLFFHHALYNPLGSSNIMILGDTFRTAASINNSSEPQIPSSRIINGVAIIDPNIKNRRRRKSKPDFPMDVPVYWRDDLEKIGGPGLMIKAGNRYYGYRDKKILCSDGPTVGEVDSEVWDMAAADGKLFATTLSGKVYCFGSNKKESPIVHHKLVPKDLPAKDNPWVDKTATLLDKCSDRKGYCVVLGIGSGQLIEELIKQSNFQIVVIDPDAAKVRIFQKKMSDANLYGNRVVAQVGNPFDSRLPAYVANLIVSENLDSFELKPDTTSFQLLYRPLRPYGGLTFIGASESTLNDITRRLLPERTLQNFVVKKVDGFLSIKRIGALKGAAYWTHQSADAGNSLVSKDKLVKLPLGLLWFGGSSNEEILPRHGHGPSPQVINGRLFIEGMHLLRAVDVYTGRILWERKIKDLGKYYDNTDHHPGAGEIGSNYVSTDDGIYIVTPDLLQVLDPATGKTIRVISPPKDDNSKWGMISVYDDVIVTTRSPIRIGWKSKSEWQNAVRLAKRKKLPPPPPLNEKKIKNITDTISLVPYSSGSRKLLVMDRKTGKALWSRDAKYNFRHNSIAIADSKVFCIDSMSASKIDYLKRRGASITEEFTLYALDTRTGNVVWETSKNIFGTWLGYSAKHDLLIQAGSSNRDRAKDEVKTGIIVYHAKTGGIVWEDLDRKLLGPLILWKDYIIPNGYGGNGVNILTGKEAPWRWQRRYGCNTAIAGENIMTFRSGAAGYYDLTNKSGTGNFGGFKSGCTSNLIMADGVLSAPDYTRTCTCSYQNQSSLALIHMPDVETWTYAPYTAERKSFGFNLGAPGDRFAENGTLWREFPVIGGPPKLNEMEKDLVAMGENIEYFSNHSLRMKGPGLVWVAGSGAINASGFSVTCRRNINKIRLYFAEPDSSVKVGERVFSISINGKEVLKDFDVIRDAGLARKVLTKEFAYIAKVDDVINLKLVASKGKTLLCGIELIEEHTKH